MSKNFVITIARGFGSQGKEIGTAVAKELGINCYDHSILTLASKLSGIDREKFAKAHEKLHEQNIFSAIKDTFSPDTKYTPVTNEQLFDFQAATIRALYESESCVIMGKCADYILKDCENVFSFYIEAPRGFCLKNIMDKMDITEYEANELITKTDKERAEYYKYYSGGNYWTNPVNYDLTLNSERVGKENCIKIIKDYVNLRLGEK